jgi:hypothetical protein
VTEQFQKPGWVQLNDCGLKHFSHLRGWDATLRAAYLGVSDKHPELIEVIVRGEKRKREVHPKFWKPAP